MLALIGAHARRGFVGKRLKSPPRGGLGIDDTCHHRFCIGGIQGRHILHVADEHHLAQNQSLNAGFFNTYFPEGVHDFVDSNKQDIFHAIQHYLRDNDIKMLAMMSKKHSFIERLFTTHVVETFAFKIDIPFLVMHSHSLQSV